jgi:conjugal transfer pilus assembly protein TraU
MKTIILFLFWSILLSAAFAEDAKIFNPSEDVNYDCAYPLVIAGASMNSSGNTGADAIDRARTMRIPAVCECQYGSYPRFGVSMGMSVPSFIMETTPIPMRMPSLGIDKSAASTVKMGGTGNHEDLGSSYSYKHTHLMGMNVLKLLELFEDTMCAGVDTAIFDLEYLSETDPTAASSSTASFSFSESILTSNPIAAIACSADAIATLGGATLDLMYWCAGGHAIHPLSNYALAENSAEDASVVMLVKTMYRKNSLDANGESTAGMTFGITTYPAVYESKVCPKSVPSPNFILKSQYRLQPAMPFKGLGCDRLGTPSIKWNSPKNSKINGDSVFVLWTRQDCCAW